MITIDDLRHFLNYDPKTGIFTWKNKTSFRVENGDIAGWIETIHGYRLIGIYGHNYRAGRLAFAYIYGRFPHEVDHINHVCDDDRICNLREASRKDNARYVRMKKNNKVGLKGVTARRNKFRANICVDGKQIYLGDWKTATEAYDAYKRAAKTYFGDFSCVS